MADGKVTIDSELNDKGLEQGLKNMQGKLEGAGKKLQSIGGSLTKSLTLPIVAAGTGALLMASKFDDSMRVVKATMGKNLGSSTKEADANFKALRDEAMKLGATTAHSASDASGAMKELAQMGYSTNQILGSTGTVLDVASASGLELDFVASTLAGSMNQFGVEVDDNGVNIKRFGDVMVRAGQMSGTSMEEIAHALEYVGSQAHNSGMDIEQTAAYIGILGDQSIKGGKAGTALSAMLRDMKAKVKDGNLEFDDFNVAMYDSQGNMRDMTDIMADLETGLEGKSDAERDAAINAVFGSQAQTAVNAIMGEGTDKVREYEKELKLANDTAKIAAGEMEGGIGGALRGLASATEALAITIGDVLAPVVRRVAQFVAELFLKFTELTDGQKKAAVAVLGVLAAIGPLLTMIGTLIIVISKVVGAFAMLSPPILIAIAAITAIIAIGVMLYQNWETLKTKAAEVFSGFAPLLERVKGAFQTLMDSVGPIVESLKQLWQSMLPIIEALAVIVGGALALAFGVIVSVFNAVISAIGPVINAFINFLSFVTGMVSAIVLLFQGDFAGAWDFVVQAGQSAIDMFVNLFTGLINFVSNFVMSIIEFFHGLYMTLVGNSIIPDMVEAIVEWFQNMFEWLIDIVMSIVEFVTDAFMSIFEVISDYFEMALEIIQASWDFIKEVFSSALDFLLALVTGDFEGMRDAIQNIMDSAKQLLMNIWNAIDDFLTKTLGDIWGTIKSIFSNILSTISSVLSSVSSVVSSIWSGIRSVITSAVNGIRSVVTSVFNAIRSVITSVLNGIRSVVSSVWSGIRSVITSTVNGIRSVVTSVFNAIRSVISSVMSGIRSTISSVWSSIRSVITSAVNAVRSVVTSVFNAIRSVISSVMSSIRSTISSVWSGIRSVITSTVNGIRSVVSSVFNALSGIVRGAMSGVRSAISSGMNSALRVVTNIGGKFKEAGGKIVSMIADGIKGAASKVTGAAKDLMGKVRDFLPFSPAKVGPLTDLDKLDFGGPIEDSIDKAVPDVNAQMNALLNVQPKQPNMNKKPKPKKDQQKEQLEDLARSIDNLASRPVSIQIDGEEIVRATAEGMDEELGWRTGMESYLRGER